MIKIGEGRSGRSDGSGRCGLCKNKTKNDWISFKAQWKTEGGVVGRGVTH